MLSIHIFCIFGFSAVNYFNHKTRFYIRTIYLPSMFYVKLNQIK